jgi:SSS family solute:Na+ symporter
VDGWDWFVVIACFAAFLGLGSIKLRGQRDDAEFFVASRRLPWWAATFSNLSTYAAVGLFSVPGWVALHEGGGLNLLQLELAIPVATMVLFVFLGFLRELELVSIYEYLERRFGLEVRLFVAGVFLLSRALSTAAIFHFAAILTASVLGIPAWATLFLLGAVSVTYTALGGLRAVVATDLLQIAMLLVTAIICLVYALDQVGGWTAALAAFSPERLRVVAVPWGSSADPEVPLWAAVVGGLFLWVAYHGCDLSQAQRQLATASPDKARWSLLLHALLRFPVAALFAAVGIAVGAVFLSHNGALALIPPGMCDAMVPTFIVHFLPAGVRALAFMAILGAVMATVDSTLNALTVVTVRDFFRRSSPTPLADELTLARLTTVFWGLALVAVAFALGGKGMLLERLVRVSAVFYGPVLGAFITGMFARRVDGSAMVAGVFVGVAFDVGLWVLASGVFWTWWSAAGCLVAAAVALGHSFGHPQLLTPALQGLIVWDSATWRRQRRWLWAHALLLAYFVVVVLACVYVPDWLT